ncbi:MAG: LPS export ABC transporter permease LptG [Pseudoxanthomonas sp.]
MRLAFPRLHDRYVGQAVLVTVLLVWAVLLGLDTLSGLSGELQDVGKASYKGDYTFGHAVAYVAYTVPRRAYTLFPTAAVIGALMGLGQLAATSELTALRALGLSRRRLTLAVAVTLALLTALMMVNMETVGAWGQQQAVNLKAAAKTGDVAQARYSGLWAREGNTFLNAQHGEEEMVQGRQELLLGDVRLYELDEDGRLAAIVHAKTARHEPGGWVLDNVLRSTFTDTSVAQTRAAEEHWKSKLDSAALSSGLSNPRYMTAADLSSSIGYRLRNGLDAREYQEQYWARWFYPLNVLTLCLAAIPFAFGSLRSGGAGKRLFLGILFALGFWLLQMLFGRLASTLRLDYRIAYALAPILMLSVSAWLFKRRSR